MMPQRPGTSQLPAEIANLLGQSVVFLWTLNHSVPAVRQANGDLQQHGTCSTDDQGRWLDVKWTEGRLVQPKFGVRHAFTPEQLRKCPQAALQASQSLIEGWEGHAGGFMIESSKAIRSGSQPDLETSTARRLGNGKLSGQQEWVPQADVDHVNRQGDALRTSGHRRQQRRGIPGAIVHGLC